MSKTLHFGKYIPCKCEKFRRDPGEKYLFPAVRPWKLTCPKRKIVFQPSIFRGYTPQNQRKCEKHRPKPPVFGFQRSVFGGRTVKLWVCKCTPNISMGFIFGDLVEVAWGQIETAVGQFILVISAWNNYDANGVICLGYLHGQLVLE